MTSTPDDGTPPAPAPAPKPSAPKPLAPEPSAPEPSTSEPPTPDPSASEAPASEPLRPVRELPAAERDWLTAALPDFGGTVAGSLVPGGYEAYVRLPHPASGDEPADVGDGPVPTTPNGRFEEVSWARVAAWSGRTLHPLAQWEQLSTPVAEPRPEPRPWDGEPPWEGTLGDRQLAALLPLLTAHTSTPEDCFFGLWDGYGFLHKGAVSFFVFPDTRSERARVRAARAVHGRGLDTSRLPLLHLPGREYLLFSGPVGAAHRVALGIGPYANDSREGPNLMWPADRSWFLASEIDLTSSYLGCSAELARALLADPRLEALPAAAGDPFDEDADTVNRDRP